MLHPQQAQLPHLPPQHMRQHMRMRMLHRHLLRAQDMPLASPILMLTDQHRWIQPSSEL